MSPESSPSSRLPASRAASQVAALADVIGGSVTNEGLAGSAAARSVPGARLREVPVTHIPVAATASGYCHM